MACGGNGTCGKCKVEIDGAWVNSCKLYPKPEEDIIISAFGWGEGREELTRIAGVEKINITEGRAREAKRQTRKTFLAGKGIADLVFYPKVGVDKPALLVELKWNKTKEAAIAQIKEKNYMNVLKNYHGNILLVGINYNQETKEHSCLIEKAFCNNP